jgi:L-lactate dehydrogenase complex protein LldG
MEQVHARQEILSAIRRQAVPRAELPQLDGQQWITYDDRVAQFASVLKAVGGNAMAVSTIDELRRELAAIRVYAGAQQVVSLVDGIPSRNVDVNGVDDPHQLADVDFAILHGRFAVAENAAVWVTDEDLRHRVIYFLAQHLALVVPAHEIVNNMHEAYKRLRFDGPSFGAFISGPSKTADIEQSLVIGAHGARSLTVFLLGGGRD